MTIKQLLATSVDDLEKMTDEELVAHLKPYMIAVESMRVPKTSSVIDVSGAAEKSAKKAENIDEFIKRMTAMMAQKMEAV
tara:strand:- start:12744 stop:12983 length:240 start_codon:yes stop_codon:yes gene_type:complete